MSASARRLEATNDVAAVFGVSVPFPVFNNGRAAIAQAHSDAQRNAARLAARRNADRDHGDEQPEPAEACA